MTLSRQFGRVALVLVVSGLVLGVTSCSRQRGSTWSPPTLSGVKKALAGLSFGAFIDTSARLHLLRFPQTVTELGLAQSLGVRDDRLDDYSSAYLGETAAIEREILVRLHSYRRDALSAEDQATYDVWEKTWTDLVAEQGISPAVRAFDSGDESANARLIRRFAAVVQIKSEDDLVDYMTCLGQAARQVNQIRTWLEREARRGVLPSHAGLVTALAQMADLRITETFSTSEYLPDRILPIHHPFFAPLRDYLVEAGVVDKTVRTTYLQEASNIVEHQIIPAYERLARLVAKLLTRMDEAA